MMTRILFICILIGQALSGLAQLSATDSLRISILYDKSERTPQGSKLNMLYLDSCLQIDPKMAEAWRELGTPHLKRGDFATWASLMEKAVAFDPKEMLVSRGWCRYKFIRDYEGALIDLKQAIQLTGDGTRHTGDGSYNLYVVMALCERELGHPEAAMQYFSYGIDSVRKWDPNRPADLYDFVHRAVLKIQLKDYKGAMDDLNREEKIYPDLAETSYYKGIILLAQKNTTAAAQQFQQADKRLTTGFRLNDVYCEIPDSIYPWDVTRQLAAIPH